jgi:LacI family transcriptional regulator
LSVTIYDIASKAKVGIGTVSRVLNNHPSVSDRTRQHVMSIAESLDYHPNASAQRLARRKSRTVTVMMPYITNYFFVEMLGGIQETLFKQDYDMMLYGVNHPRQAENYLQRSIRVGHSDGILVASLDIPQSYTQKCLRDNFPLIMLDRYNEHFDSYSVDSVEGARAATQYLVSLGHRHIAMITGIAESIPSIERTAGYRQAIAEANDQVRNLGVFHPSDERINDGFSKESGYEVMKHILQLPADRQPTGVFIASDIQAFGAIHALREHNLSCPEDMSIVSFDDIEMSTYYGLTTMHQPIHSIGVLATTRLFERLDDPRLHPEHTVFKPELVIRNTAAAPCARVAT